ncbi:MAG TPA: hypothetical protein VH595_11140 [Verrucomicrobiae bacterium]|nr:hypothetical protein [Verrucomicrobiae bacterium]
MALGFWKGFYVWAEGAMGFVWGYCQCRHRATQFSQCEDSLRRIGKWGFIVTLLVGMFVFAPYGVYKNTLAKYGSEGVCWTPPSINWTRQEFWLVFGGTSNQEGQPFRFDIYQLRSAGLDIVKLKDRYAKEYPAITARCKHNSVFFDVEIPTGSKHIKLEYGETEILPKGWDWNCDKTALEIVDDQRRVVFREQWKTTNVIWMQGTIVFQGSAISSTDYGYINIVPNAEFDVGEVYLPPIFQYPSMDHKGERVNK